jgi:hypothetical protein
MFRRKGIIILYKTKDGNGGTRQGSYGYLQRFTSYAGLFQRTYEELVEKLGDDFVITNVIKL